MALITTTADGVVQNHDLPDNPLTVIAHPQGIRVDVPEFVEINPKNTIRTMEDMTQTEWQYISNGDLFKELWNTVFPGDKAIKIPTTIEELNSGDMGCAHVAGMIVLACEALFEGKKVFFRTPETYLHPATCANLTDMIVKIGRIGNAKTTVADPEQDKQQCLVWLNAMEANTRKRPNLEQRAIKVGTGNPTSLSRVIAYLDDKDKTPVTCADAIEHVKADTALGKKMIALFTAARDSSIPK
jgi:DNA topoisomerase VI subunit B